ncbi:hypothetical protein GCM10022408_03220 [Hymenobacter fastidiosus]|uniref:DUF3850 domain-containing protein n=1 Tax=Hymenobacter fastidiosus TaxID=486264 RepID=A0ABP7RDS5_9BACT
MTRHTLLSDLTPGLTQRSTHELKTWPACFDAVEAGIKPFDVRENDRDFQVGDALLLREYEPESEQYSGRTAARWISYVLLGGTFGVEAGWCVLGFGEQPPLPPGINDTKLW